MTETPADDAPQASARKRVLTPVGLPEGAREELYRSRAIWGQKRRWRGKPRSRDPGALTALATIGFWSPLTEELAPDALGRRRWRHAGTTYCERLDDREMLGALASARRRAGSAAEFRARLESDGIRVSERTLARVEREFTARTRAWHRPPGDRRHEPRTRGELPSPFRD